MRLIVLNWKMYPDSLKGARHLFKETVKVLKTVRGVRTVVCPPAPYLHELAGRYRGKAVSFGAQGVHGELRGAHTGEISVLMLKDARVRFVIVGHSERRAIGETDEMVAGKVGTAVRAGVTPIICIGEQVRSDSGEHFVFIKNQLLQATSLLAKEELKKVVIAYEPIWAIGKSAQDALTPALMHEMSIYIRKVLAEKFGREFIENVPILYGGSVEPKNSGALMHGGDISGFLIGHTSLDPQALKEVLHSL